MNILIIFLERIGAVLNPYENKRTSAINSLSGTDIATGLNNCFKLSGNLERPPYPLPAGFNVTKIPLFEFTSIYLLRSIILFCLSFNASIIN